MRVLEQLMEEAKILSYYKSSSSWYVVVLTGGGVHVFLDNGEVEYMQGDFYLEYIQGDFYTVEFRVKQIIERFGEPEGVSFPDGTPEIDLSCEELEDSPDWDPAGGFLLLYPSKGVSFGGYKYYYGFICPEMLAIRFYYYQPRSLSEAFSEGGSPVFGRADCDSEDIVEWHGYGQGY